MNPLPKVGDPETLKLDFKSEASAQPEFEKAKDVAAMANAMGGRILVGAVDERSTLSHFKPMPRDHALAVARAYSESVRDRCRPAPVVSPKVIPHGEGCLVDVSVEPFPGPPVGVRVKADRGDGFGGDTWHFPLRVADQTVGISPENLPMYMDPEVRRKVLILDQITQFLEVSVHHMERLGPWHEVAKFDRVDLKHNVVRLFEIDPIPLDDVAAVYFDGKTWVIRERVSLS